MPQGTGPENHDITLLLEHWHGGDREALGRLIQLVYPELQRIARARLRAYAKDGTLQCTALVHEAYLRLSEGNRGEWKNRTHFFAVAARVIHGVLVDYVRERTAGKRGGGSVVLSLTDGDPTSTNDPSSADLLDLEIALSELRTLDPRQYRIVETRYFGGLSVEETAEALGLSTATVKRDWTVAKAFIRHRLMGDHRVNVT